MMQKIDDFLNFRDQQPVVKMIEVFRDQPGGRINIRMEEEGGTSKSLAMTPREATGLAILLLKGVLEDQEVKPLHLK